MDLDTTCILGINSMSLDFSSVPYSTGGTYNLTWLHIP